MRFMAAGFFVFLSLSILTTFLHSQDQANDAIKEFKKAVADARKNYDGSIEGAKEKKDREIAAATQAALKALKDELSSSGPGEVARAIQLAKRIYQLDPEDEEAKKILLAAGIDLDTIKPVNPNPDVPAAPKEAPAVQAPPAPPPPSRIPLGTLNADPINNTPPQGSDSLRNKINQLSSGTGTSFDYYPIQKNKRPLTLPSGASESGLGLSYLTGPVLVEDWDGWLSYAEAEVFAVTAHGFIGVSENITLGAEVGFGFLSVDDYGSDTDFLPIELLGVFSIHKSETIDVAGSAYLPLNVFGPGDAFDRLQLGLPTRFRFNDDALALYVGQNLLTLGGDTTNVNLWMGIGLQVSDNVNLRLSILPISIGDTPSGTPLEFLYTYSATNSSDIFVAYRNLYDIDAIVFGWSLRSF